MSAGAQMTNDATLVVRDFALLGPLLGRLVGMLAARAQCPVDRLDDALLLTDAVAAHAPPHTADGAVRVRVETGEAGLALRVGPLAAGGARAMLADAVLPGVGNVFERVADAVGTDATDGGEELVVQLGFGR